ncbi:hypothetical protein Ocin01_02959 [Orchesella cincta]|uniref:Uncharacterized protein n=1 Tax=Orchesella cincta TaxID=48709 RepID=A0A1D2NEP5_ORCCI|nr:hypothetical protein Ocin01_02959 [Orchesella cincta]
MMCTCRYCLCFFNVVVIINTCMLALLVSTYAFFGNMPPSFSMAMGFWLLVYTNYFGIYVTLLSAATFYRDKDVWWINRLTSGGIIGCAICFFLGGILFLIPISAEAMMSFSKFYFFIYGTIPPFLDNFQAKFKCCGIYNYLDYGRKDFTNYGYNQTGFLVFRQADENDDFWHQLINDLTLNRTIVRRTTGLDVPQSCCPIHLTTEKRHSDCGKKVEYTKADDSTPELLAKQKESARLKINDPSMGCYQKYRKILDTGYQFQLTYLLGAVQFGSLFQCALFMALLWFHKLALKTIRQLNYWLPTLIKLHQTVEMAEAHANLEAEADESHEPEEHRQRKPRGSSSRRGRSKSLHNVGKLGGRRSTSARGSKDANSI